MSTCCYLQSLICGAWHSWSHKCILPGGADCVTLSAWDLLLNVCFVMLTGSGTLFWSALRSDPAQLWVGLYFFTFFFFFFKFTLTNINITWYISYSCNIYQVAFNFILVKIQNKKWKNLHLHHTITLNLVKAILLSIPDYFIWSQWQCKLIVWCIWTIFISHSESFVWFICHCVCLYNLSIEEVFLNV